ncbi:MAG: hypothetical protein KIT14_07180 [bacterium]|nr:hypothetical protein [bacterium]
MRTLSQPTTTIAVRSHALRALCLMMTVASASGVGLGAAPAHATTSLGAWIQHSPDDINATDVPGFQTLSGNDNVVTPTLPFSVTIDGVAYTSVAISTNGWLELGGNTAPNSDPVNDCLPTPKHTRPFLAAYWDDLQTQGTHIRYGTVGTAPNRTFFVDAQADTVAGTSDVLRYQVQIHEGSNLLTVRYRATEHQANGQLATIGWQSAGGAGASAQPLTCNGKILDDNRPDEGFSVDPSVPGRHVVFAVMAHSPDDITGFTTLSGNDNVATPTLPFSVTIGGASYNTVAISTNGWLEFGGNTAANSTPSDFPLPTALHTNPFLAAYWDDLQTQGTHIRYGTVGSAPNRVFIADFYGDTVAAGSNDIVAFQVQVHELSNVINVKYRDPLGVNAGGPLATIGFQTAGGASALAFPLSSNGRVLDDDRNNAMAWSIHAGPGVPVLHATIAHSPNDISGFTTLSGDNQVAGVTLPFNVVIDGVAYSSVAVSTNGWLELGGNTAADSTPGNTALPTAVHTNPFLAAFWDDLVPEGTMVRYGTVGASPNRTFVVDWQAYIQPSPDSANDGIAFQAQIHETSNAINVQYRTSERYASGQTATIGWQGAGGAAATARALTFNGRILDDNLPNAGWSVSPIPVCGNGIGEPAAGEQCDLGGANGAPTSCCTTSCTYKTAGTTCRAGGGAPCDLDETCSGASAACPADDAPGKVGLTCRIGSGDVCDPDELCNGVPGVACPADVVAAPSTVCRAGSGDMCDLAETCTGVPGATCPANVFASAATVCRPGSGDACDAHEHCPGLAGGTCPADDAPLKAGVVCRTGSGDACDANEACTGVPGATCPPDDAPGKAGTICRPSSVAGAFCDEPEACTGVPGATCPANDAPLKVNVICRPGSGDLCDPAERCTGISGQGCPPDVVAPPTTVCRAGSGDACDPAERCTAVPGAPCPANQVEPDGTVCRAATGVCDVAEKCSGTAGQACPADAYAPAGGTCDADGDLCTLDRCDGHGACTTTGPLDCDDGNRCTQDTCDPVLGCVAAGTPSNACLAGSKVTFQVKDSLNDSSDRLKMSWKGGPMLIPDLGDPRVATVYELCIYDDTGVKMALDVPAGPAWSAIGSAASPRGFKFKGNGSADGVRTILLKGSSLPKASFKVVAKGGALPDTTLPFQSPVVAQLYAGDGMCWDATFGVAHTKKNDVGGFSAKVQ